MTNEEILEVNKLLAKFDNRLSFKNDKKNHAEWVGCISGEIGNAFMSNQLKYHKSWEWLMPVVEKIKTLKYVDEFNICYDECAKGTSIQILPTYRDTFEYFYIEPTQNTFAGIYQIVIQFINWYNKYLKDNESSTN